MEKLKLVFACAGIYLFLNSCSANRNAPVSSKPVVVSSEASASPSTFRCSSIIYEVSNVDSFKCLYYKIIIRDVLERGSSLIYQPAQHDSIPLKDCAVSNHVTVRKGDEVNVLVEERIRLNSDMPEFILRQITKR